MKVSLPLADLHPDKIPYSSFLGVKNVQSVSKIIEINIAKINFILTVFIRLNAAAFIKFLAFPMRRLFKGGGYSRAAFITKSLFLQ